MKLTALIVEDEPLARAHLRSLLEEQAVIVAGEAEDAVRAIQLAEELNPDLMFLDIQMPGLTGLQLAEAMQNSSSNSLIVFVTGYSEYAVAAFERAALDYLLKPISPERLARTIVRAREQLAGSAARTALTRLQEEIAPAEKPRLRRLPIRQDYAVRLLRVEEVCAAVAKEKRVFVRTADGEEYRTYYTLTQLESMLPEEQFFRMHDSCIVNIGNIEEILFLGNHSYAVQLTNGNRLPVGRSRYAALQSRLGLES